MLRGSIHHGFGYQLQVNYGATTKKKGEQGATWKQGTCSSSWMDCTKTWNYEDRVDAGVSKNTCVGSVAMVARDDSGVFLGASTVFFEVLYGPQTLEALACCEVMVLAEDLLLHKIATASDCRAIVRISRHHQRFRMYTFWWRYKRRKRPSRKFISCTRTWTQTKMLTINLAHSAFYPPVGRNIWLTGPPKGTLYLSKYP